MKNIINLIFSILICISCGSNYVYANQEISIKINNSYLTPDVSPIMVEDRVLVPMRSICEALKCEVLWDDETQTAQIQNPLTIIAVKIGAGYITKIDREDRKNVKELPVDVPAMLVNDRTMLPARAIAEALHAIVDWNQQYNTVEITMEYDYIGDFYQGYAIVCKNDKYGIINENRDVIVRTEYDSISSKGFYDNSSGGRFADTAVVKKANKWGHVGLDGEVVIPIEYDEPFRFYGDLADVQKNGKYGFINKKGGTVIPFIYDDIVGGFYKNLAAVKKDGYYGFINKDGETVIPFEYDYAYRFNSNTDTAKVKKNGVEFSINMKGERVK